MAKPDYNLCVVQEDRKGFSQLGAAWVNDKGQIQIKLNPCVTLSDRSDIKIYLFKAETTWRDNRRSDSKPINPDDYGPPPMDDDDVPF